MVWEWGSAWLSQECEWDPRASHVDDFLFLSFIKVRPTMTWQPVKKAGPHLEWRLSYVRVGAQYAYIHDGNLGAWTPRTPKRAPIPYDLAHVTSGRTSLNHL